MRQRAHACSVGHVRNQHRRDGGLRPAPAQSGTSRSRPGANQPVIISGDRRFPIRPFRELGERVSPDVGLCHPDCDALSARTAESRDPDDPHRPGDEIASHKSRRWPILSWVYSYSLGLALATLFIASFALHWWSSLRATNEQALIHGIPPASMGEHLASAQLWFESFQNWQSEFLSTAVLVVLSIFLRHKGSPESKPCQPRTATPAQTRCLGRRRLPASFALNLLWPPGLEALPRPSPPGPCRIPAAMRGISTPYNRLFTAVRPLLALPSR